MPTQTIQNCTIFLVFTRLWNAVHLWALCVRVCVRARPPPRLAYFPPVFTQKRLLTKYRRVRSK